MTVYTGDVVHYGSGGTWYTQLTVTDNGPTTGPTTGLHITSQIVFSGGIDDKTNTINGTDPAGGWSNNNATISGGGGTYNVQQRDFECGIVYGGSSAHITLYATGFATGSTGPSGVDINYPMPARQASPPSPPAVGVNSIGTTSAHLFCSAAGAENGAGADYVNYRIHRVSDGAWMGDIGGPGIGYAGVTYTNLAIATTYDAYAQTHNAAGYGGFSVATRFTTLATVPGAPPTTVSGVTATGATVNVSAAAPNGAGIDAYETTIATDSGFATIVRTWAGGSGSVTGLIRATNYWARSRAHNGLGWGPYSAAVPFTTLGTIPSPPGTPDTSVINPDSATLIWTAPGDTGGSTITSYAIQVALNSTFTTGLISTTSTTLSKVISGLVPGTLYYMRVAATNSIGGSNWSGIGSFTTMAGIKVKVGGVWVNAKLWVKVAGNWVPAKVWKKDGTGTWVI